MVVNSNHNYSTAGECFDCLGRVRRSAFHLFAILESAYSFHNSTTMDSNDFEIPIYLVP